MIRVFPQVSRYHEKQTAKDYKVAFSDFATKRLEYWHER